MKSFLFAASAIALTAGLAAAEPITIRFSHIVAASGHPKGEAVEMFREMVAERLAGRVEVEVFPNASLYNDEKVLEAIALGNVEMAAPALSKFETFTPAFRVFDLPFLFENEDAVDAFQTSGPGQELLASLEDGGFVGLGYWRNGLKQISANVPLIEPSDAAGLKFRIQPSDVIQAQFQALGANPQKMAYPEVYGALSSGVVDGQENTWTNIYKSKFFEVQDGFTESDHGVIDYAVVASADFWNGLPDDIRDELTTILVEVTAEEKRLARSLNDEARAAVQAAGSEIRTLTPEQRAAWQEAMRPVWDRFSDEIGTDLIDAALAATPS